jgi:bacillolysin
MKKQYALSLALCFAGIGAFAQGNYSVTPGKIGMYPADVKFSEGAEPDFVPGTVLLKQQDAFVPSREVALLHTERDQLKMEHIRYQQKINNIPVEGSMYIMHVAAGKVKSMNGVWVSSEASALSASAAISESTALQNALKAFGAKSYKWEVASEEAFIKAEQGNQSATYRPKAELVYYSGEQEVSGDKLRLAYKLDIYAQQPIGRRIYFVDAETGKVLGVRELIHTAGVQGTAVTGYSGTQTIDCDQVSATSYRLQETVRGNGIFTFNLGRGTTYVNTDFTDADNVWANVNTNYDQYATDAHWGAEKTYDYFLNAHGRNSINGTGLAIYSYVHYSTNYFNAFWDGLRMTYGDGNNGKPLTSIDVCGHEITHGITQYTANLNYSNESGALNEGFSDIFGTAIEYYAKPLAANWLMGSDFGAIRSMSNPNAYGQPDTYKGTAWATGTADYGGVHTNSGVLNFWFYLLTTGGSGTNDKASAYSVTGIGMANAAAIAYRTLTVYLTPTSQYIDARAKSIQAATDLFGAASTQVTQVIKAWDAVGVTTSVAPPPPTCADNYETNENKGGSKSIAVNADITARVGSSIDKDWFTVVTTTAAPKLKVTLSNLPTDYDLTLYNNKGKAIASSRNGGLTAESITYNSASSGATYYVQVSGYNGANSANCYSLRAATSNVNQLTDGPTFGMEDESEDFGKPAENLMEMSSEDMTVYPNPAKDKLNVNFTAAEAGTTSVSITDLMGRVVMQQEISVEEGMNTIALPLNYMPGLYFLNVAGQTPTKFQIMQ